MKNIESLFFMMNILADGVACQEIAQPSNKQKNATDEPVRLKSLSVALGPGRPVFGS